MSIYVLDWIKEDLQLQGKNLKDFTILQLKETLSQYNNKYIRQNIIN